MILSSIFDLQREEHRVSSNKPDGSMVSRHGVSSTICPTPDSVIGFFSEFIPKYQFHLSSIDVFSADFGEKSIAPPCPPPTLPNAQEICQKNLNLKEHFPIFAPSPPPNTKNHQCFRARDLFCTRHILRHWPITEKRRSCYRREGEPLWPSVVKTSVFFILRNIFWTFWKKSTSLWEKSSKTKKNHSRSAKYQKKTPVAD